VLIAALAVATGGAADQPGTEPESTPPMVDTSVPGSLPPELEVALVNAADLGLPIDWVVRDLDPHVLLDEAEQADTDPFLGLLDCPEGAVRENADVEWISRRFAAPDLPLENGVLAVEVIVELESAEDAEADSSLLAECTAGEFAEVTVSTIEVGPPTSDEKATQPEGDPINGVALELLSSPTAEVAYPSAFNLVSVNVDDRTVTVIVSGIDMGVSWEPVASDTAWQLLEARH
jgi:hypothetical protein